MDTVLAELRRRLAEVHDLRQVTLALEWDQLVMMPRGGAAARAEQLATLQGLAHERFTDPEVGRLLERLRPLEESLDYDSDDASLIRVARRDYEKARRVPTELSAEITRVASAAQEVWAEARARNDFASFRPWLDRNLELKRRYLECFEPADEEYDLLLDDYEPDMKTAEVRAVFDRIRPELTELAAEAGATEQPAFMRGPFPEAEQERLSRLVVERFGGTWDDFRLDRTVHPFCSSLATRDIRLTTRYCETDLHSLFSTMHECGHGLYEHGISPALERTPLCSGVSSALHESQSRLWENVVGRSLPFWRGFFPELEAAFPDVLGDVGVEDFYRAVNRVEPSLIRVDADEVTYGLHVIVRFELEQELIAGRLSTAELPEAWNARYAEYIGVDVPEDRLGVLQDIHWAFNGFGYFPTYQLGNVISLQIWEKANEAMPDLDAQIEAGELRPLGTWLREQLYALGRKFTPAETLERVVGGPIDPEPYLRYLRAKYGAGVAA
ncbi:MAG TPA: carboxypeptidase M32 [Gaiellaceae bacterium]|nr:carboxypeptidase M32 [Gaiellaceae bacterium]